MKRLIPVLIIAASLAACVNLKEVRDFAGESGRLSAYTELTTRFRDTYERERPYLSGDNLSGEAKNDTGRKEVYPDLIKVHDRVSLYLKTLAKLAGDETFDLSKQIGAVADGIKANSSFGLEEKHVKAYSDLGMIAAKWITSAYQQSAVREMVREGDGQLQVLLSGMGDLVRLYRKTHIQEKKTVLGFFDIEVPFLDTSQDQLLRVLTQAHVQAKEKEYATAEAKYDEVAKGIQKIAEGHSVLFRNVNTLDLDEVKAQMGNISKDIKAVREHIQTLQN